LWPKNEMEKQMKRVPYKYYPKFQRRYHPIFRSGFQPRFRATFRSQWDALIEMRQKQRRAYTTEEWEKLRPKLTEEWRKRHEKYALDVKAHEEALKTMRSKVPSNYRPTYHPVYRPTYRSVYNPSLRSAYRPVFRPVPRKRMKSKSKYRCTECGSGHLWLNDYLNHIKMEHKGKHPLRLPRIHN